MFFLKIRLDLQYFWIISIADNSRFLNTEDVEVNVFTHVESSNDKSGKKNDKSIEEKDHFHGISART